MQNLRHVVLLFLKSHMLVVISGLSVPSDQAGSSKQSQDLQKSWGQMSLDEAGLLNKKWSEFSSFGKRRVGEGDVEGDSNWAGLANWGKNQGKRWKEMAVWGKRDEIPHKKWKEVSVWGKRDDEIPEKKWKEVSVWGKRDDEIPEKKWKEMAVWGKRDEIPEKKWKEMAVWGKRDDEIPEKKWKEMAVWGKREGIPEKKWKEMAVWGKRDDEIPEKKWKEMAVWGKRDGDLEKKWKEVAVWGKRNADALDKKWKEMSVWGKRNADPGLSKKWKSMAAWGKRSIDSPSALSTFRPIRNWSHIDNVWDKRPSWRRTGFKSWGKRSSLAGEGPTRYQRALAAEQARFQKQLHQLRKFLVSSAQEGTVQGFPRQEGPADTEGGDGAR